MRRTLLFILLALFSQRAIACKKGLAAVADAAPEQKATLVVAAYRELFTTLRAQSLTDAEIASLSRDPFSLGEAEGGRGEIKALLKEFENLSRSLGEAEEKMIREQARAIVHEHSTRAVLPGEATRKQSETSERAAAKPDSVLRTESEIRYPVLTLDGKYALHGTNRIAPLDGSAISFFDQNLTADWGKLVLDPAGDWVLQLFARETQPSQLRWFPAPGRTPAKPNAFPVAELEKHFTQPTDALLSADGSALAVYDQRRESILVFHSHKLNEPVVIAGTSQLAGISANGSRVWYRPAHKELAFRVGRNIMVVTDAGSHLKWSVVAPNDAAPAIAIGYDSTDSPSPGPAKIYAIDPANGRVLRSVTMEAGMKTDLSPRGDVVVQILQAKTGFEAALWSTQSMSRIGGARWDTTFRGITFSPDGKKILFTRDGYGVKPIGTGGVAEVYDVDEWVKHGALLVPSRP